MSTYGRCIHTLLVPLTEVLAVSTSLLTFTMSPSSTAASNCWVGERGSWREERERVERRGSGKEGRMREGGDWEIGKISRENTRCGWKRGGKREGGR